VRCCSRRIGTRPAARDDDSSRDPGHEQRRGKR
jgi:hypothetical protein